MWVFEQVHPDRSAVSGDLGKVFKNEQYKNPGVLGANPPGVHATLIAREVIQNSWDAARVLERALQEQGQEVPDFRLVFRFRALIGQTKADAAARLGLAELAGRLDGGEDRQEFRRSVGLSETDCLDELADSGAPLRLLEIEEHATTGMDGPWKEDLSKLWLALVSSGFTAKEQGAGGSYGYGKAGLIRGSAIRTVLAHTAFRERPDDPDVTSRLLGMTYWGRHRTDEGAFTGFARLGAPAEDGSIVPLQNSDADELASALGLMERDASDPETLGSTFLLVQPTATPEQLRRAVERNWWPALLDGDRFDVEIIGYDEEEHPPKPKSDEVLLTFTRAYELATVSQDNTQDEERSIDVGSYQPQGTARVHLGRLGLVANRESWSYAQSTVGDDEAVSHESMVALVRGPRMIVEYYVVPGGPPYVRGALPGDGDRSRVAQGRGLGPRGAHARRAGR